MVDRELVDAKAILLPQQEQDDDLENFEDDQMDMEDYEFDILWNKDKELWVTTLIDGNYLINVKAKGYKEINEVISIRSGASMKYSYNLTNIKNDNSKLTVTAVNAKNGKKVSSVFLELWKESI